MPTLLSHLVLLAVLLAGLAACGDSGGSAGPDRSEYKTVYRLAMQAVADRDLEALWPLLTEHGRQGVERELRQFQAALGGGEGAELLLPLVRERVPDVTAEEIALAAGGTLPDVWRFLLKADPREAEPKQAGLELAPDGRGVRMLYHGPDGTIREVRLVQRPSGWYVDLLQL